MENQKGIINTGGNDEVYYPQNQTSSYVYKYMVKKENISEKDIEFNNLYRDVCNDTD